MNATIAIWATSTVGAALFLAAGFIWGRGRATPDSQPTPTPGPSATEGAMFRKATQLEARLAEVEAQQAQAVSDCTAAVAERNEAIRARDEALARQDASPVQAPGESLQYQVISLETEVKQLRDEKVILNTKTVALEQELERLKRPKKKDTADVEKLVSEQASLERRRKELELTRASLNRHKVENKKLTANVRALEAEKVRLEMQLEDSRQVDLTAENTHDTIRFSAVATTPITDVSDTDLQALVDKVATGADVRVAVLADSLGLKVVGRGPETDELAAAAALLADVGQRTIKLLPVEALHRLELITDDALQASVFPFSTARGDLVLASLSRGTGPDLDLVERVKERVARVV